jgi:hypothetical protein
LTKILLNQHKVKENAFSYIFLTIFSHSTMKLAMSTFIINEPFSPDLKGSTEMDAAPPGLEHGEERQVQDVL